VVLALAAGAAGWFAWKHYFEAGPRRGAAEAISRAEQRFDQALEHEDNQRFDEALGSARAALTEARASFSGNEFDEAQLSAERSERISRMVLDIAKGETSREKVVRFYRIEGDVRVKRKGTFSWEAADMDTALQVGDMIKTSSGASSQIVHFDGTVTTIQPGSLLEIRELYENPVTKVRKVTEKLNWGEVTASTARRNVDGSVHEVATDKISARSAEEGEFRVSADRNDKTATVDVFTGRVEVEGRGTKEVIAEGERLRAASDGRLGNKELLPGVPKLLTPADEMVFVYETPSSSTTRLAWERIPLAAKYRLLISDRFLFTNPRYDNYRSDSEVVIDGI
ncbi:MAG: FecR domain-containing protein, partial [Acidobacteriota bacterium]|nr:FecR domain-containing protein [Acidobacteriota bacterium]